MNICKQKRINQSSINNLKFKSSLALAFDQKIDNVMK